MAALPCPAMVIGVAAAGHTDSPRRPVERLAAELVLRAILVFPATRSADARAKKNRLVADEAALAFLVLGARFILALDPLDGGASRGTWLAASYEEATQREDDLHRTHVPPLKQATCLY